MPIAQFFRGKSLKISTLIRASSGSVLLLSLSACQIFSSPEVQPELITQVQEESAKRAITEITQTLNLSADKSWASLIDILTDRKISIDTNEPARGLMETAWVPITDKFCGSYPNEGAPLSCKVRYTINIKALSPRASRIHLKYLERCIEHDAGPLECPDSKAEKLMLAILKDLKKAGGVVD